MQLIRSVVVLSRTNAAILTIAIILLIELLLHPYLSHTFFSHEVDETLHYLRTPYRDHVVVAFGDSVGNGIFAGWGFDSGSLANLASNQATETAGQYFLLKRFLKNNRFPEAVVICDRAPFSGNLDQNLTENYIQRCFTEWSEIFELMMVKRDPVFTVKMIAYKLFSTFAYRLHLQQKVVGFTNGDIYSGSNNNNYSVNADYGLIRVVAKYLKNRRKRSISSYFLSKMITNLEEIQVPLYYLPPPSRFDNEFTHKLIKASIKNMEELQKRFGNVYVLREAYLRMSERHFRDEAHLNREGLKVYRPYTKPFLEPIIAAAVLRREERTNLALAAGAPIFSDNFQTGSTTIQPINDATITFVKENLLVRSTGNDPSLLLPTVPSIKKKKSDRLILRVVLDSPKPTVAQVYFAPDTSTSFSEQLSVKQPVLFGSNTLFFILPSQFSGGILRFDPGRVAGTFTLLEVTAAIIDERLLGL